MSQLTHVQLVEKIIGQLQSSDDQGLRELLASAQHIELAPEIYKAAGMFQWQLAENTELFVDSTSLPPANITTLRIGEENSVFLLHKANKVVTADLVGADGRIYRQFGWQPGTNRIWVHSLFEMKTEETELKLHWTALTLAMTLSLINSPKLVELSPSGTRQQRRAAQRLVNLPVDAWHKVTWRTAVGTKRNVAKGSAEDRDAGSVRQPLHFRRGHLRTAEKHYQGAFQTVYTSTGWGQWIDGAWAGNPAYGIKKSIFSPRLDQRGFSAFIKAAEEDRAKEPRGSGV